ncbi:MAG TPA: c-type cytochrome domain-containing protein [Verrucomicrobiae bacterium]|nr:c-type cytochrome domain-containing protein [Verrucomicrobiae bacterium]
MSRAENICSQLPVFRAEASREWVLVFTVFLLAIGSLSRVYPAEAVTQAPGYEKVDAIFASRCLDCHGASDPDGNLVLESCQTLLKGGDAGAVIVPGKSDRSLLVQMIEGRYEKNGKKKIMPPGKREKLTPEQIGIIRAWIDAGAHGPTTAIARQLVVPQVVPVGSPRDPVNALAFSARGGLVAIARYGEVQLRSAENFNLVRRLAGQQGNVNALVFSSDGKTLFAAGGQPGWGGETRRWNVIDGKLLGVMHGHSDAVYSVALSPDGKVLATGSYDQKIKLWEAATGKELKTLSGHNGCVYALAFRPDGKVLASASADRTVKLWDAQTGERLDTFSQSLKEIYALAFTPDGKRLFAGGSDNRLRVWEISEKANENTNPLLVSLFAHEGAILRLFMAEDGKTLISCADDRTVKLWDVAALKERAVLENQPDWVTAAAFLPRQRILLGRMDGSLTLWDETTGKLSAPPALTASAQGLGVSQ